jgi:hypothetical protein
MRWSSQSRPISGTESRSAGASGKRQLGPSFAGAPSALTAGWQKCAGFPIPPWPAYARPPTPWGQEQGPVATAGAGQSTPPRAEPPSPRPCRRIREAASGGRPKRQAWRRPRCTERLRRFAGCERNLPSTPHRPRQFSRWRTLAPCTPKMSRWAASTKLQTSSGEGHGPAWNWPTPWKGAPGLADKSDPAVNRRA